MNKLRKGDEIIVIAGKDKGRRGTVLQIVDEDRVLVEGINIAKKHTKANPNMGVEGGILDRDMPLAVSNVLVFNPKTKKATGWEFAYRTMARLRKGSSNPAAKPLTFE